ncbi:MAG TPA: PfkB family carbohydrate kinase [Candidatus Dormibacteraeota bacterium]
MTAAGTLGFDDLTSSAGSARAVPGGSALYFSLAARRLCPVRVAAAVGADGGPLLALLDSAAVDRSGVAALPGATYRWRAEHRLADPVPLSEEQSLGVYREWRPDLPAPLRRSEILFLGSMPPVRQIEVLDQSSPQVVALDTMRDFATTERDLLEDLLLRCDLFFANEAELRALLPSAPPDPVDAAQAGVERWHLTALVLKLGAEGALVVSSGRVSRVAPATGPAVVDPTGAGDALAGGVIGRLAQLRRCDQGAIDQGLVDGGVAARRAISAFGPGGLL